MPILYFTSLPAPAEFTIWDFEVLESRITFHLEDVRDAYAGYLECHRDHVALPEGWPRRQAYLYIARLCRLLSDRLAQGGDLNADVEIEHADSYVGGHCSDLMFDRRFVCATCPACGQSYGPAECSVKAWLWTEDEERGVEGDAAAGRRVVCPAGHTLYSDTQWSRDA